MCVCGFGCFYLFNIDGCAFAGMKIRLNVSVNVSISVCACVCMRACVCACVCLWGGFVVLFSGYVLC